MAKTKGSLGVVLVGAAPTVVGEVRGITINPVFAVNEGAAMGSGDSVPRPGLVRTTGSIRAWFDAGDSGQISIVEGSNLDIVYRPAGTGSGLPETTVANALITASNLQGAVETDVEIEFSFEAGGVPDRTPQP